MHRPTVDEVTIKEQFEGDYVLLTPQVPKGHVYPKDAPPLTTKEELERLPEAEHIAKFPPVRPETIQKIVAQLQQLGRNELNAEITNEKGVWRFPADTPEEIREMFKAALGKEASENPSVANFKCHMNIRCPDRTTYIQSLKGAHLPHTDRGPNRARRVYTLSARYPTLIFSGKVPLDSGQLEASLIERDQLIRNARIEAAKAALAGSDNDVRIAQLMPLSLDRVTTYENAVVHVSPELEPALSDPQHQQALKEAIEKHWPLDEHRLFVGFIFDVDN